MDISHEHVIEIPGLVHNAEEVKAKLHVGSLLGKLFGSEDTCECDGFLVRKIETAKYNEARRKMVTLKHYTIERIMVQETFDFATNCAQRAQQG